MKFSDDMRFAHPVLTDETGDFSEGCFALDTEVEEIIETGKVSIRYSIDLTETFIRELVENGKASVGIFVRCGDTFYSELRELGWPEGKVEFEKGSLLNRVTVRPIIWLSQPLLPRTSSAFAQSDQEPARGGRAYAQALGITHEQYVCRAWWVAGSM